MVVLRALFTRRTWAETCYLIAAVPFAVAGFLLFLPVLPGIGLFLFGLGAVIVAAVLTLARAYAPVHRWLAGKLLGRVWEPTVVLPAPRRTFLAWVTGTLRSGASWRALLHAFLNFPLTVVSAYATVLCWAWAVLATLWPVLWLLDGKVLPDRAIRNGLTVGRFHFDSWPLALVASGLGIVALFLVPWVVRGLVIIHMWLAAQLVGRPGLAERVRDLERSRALAVDDSAARLRRIERDLHDGTQARLVQLAMNLTMVRESLGGAEPDLDQTRTLVEDASGHVKETIAELREIARGIHPPVLDKGLGEALTTLAARTAVPVRWKVRLPERPSPAIETIAYFCAAELIANAVRHARPEAVYLSVDQPSGRLRLMVEDDGPGGAQPNPGAPSGSGSGLAGLIDRVRVVDGRLDIDSPPGGPTRVTVDLPLTV